MYTLFYSPHACSLASHIALAESGLPYEVRRLNFAENEQRSPEYLKHNPNGRVPVLVDDDPIGPGDTPLTVWESAACLQYLADKTGRYLPADTQKLFFAWNGVGLVAYMLYGMHQSKLAKRARAG